MAKIDETITEEIKTIEVPICEVRDNCVFVYINGWVAFVKFANPEVQSKQFNIGNIITIEYEGDLEKDTDGCFNIKILPLK